MSTALWLLPASLNCHPVSGSLTFSRLHFLQLRSEHHLWNSAFIPPQLEAGAQTSNCYFSSCLSFNSWQQTIKRLMKHCPVNSTAVLIYELICWKILPILKSSSHYPKALLYSLKVFKTQISLFFIKTKLSSVFGPRLLKKFRSHYYTR